MTRPRIYQIELTIDGHDRDDVSPETVPLGDVATVLRDYERAILGMVEGTEDSSIQMGLVAVRRGSDRLVIQANSLAFREHQRISRAIKRQTVSRLPYSTQQHLARISEVLVKQSLNLKLSSPEKGGITSQFGKISPIDKAVSETEVRDRTMCLYGTLIQIGGEPCEARLRLDEGNIVRLSVERDVARRLGARIYDEVGVSAFVQIETASGEIQSGKVARLLSYEPTSVSESFQELANCGAGAWDGVDARKFVRDLRGGAE